MYQQTNIFLVFVFMFLLPSIFVQAQFGRNHLNKDLGFYGDHIIYKGKTISLGPHALYVDRQLTSSEAPGINTFD